MADLMSILQLLITCGSLLVFAFLVLLAMPQSRLREVFMPIVGWTLALFCGAYCISPVDIIPEIALGPFGLIDDLGVGALGIAAAIAAYKAGKHA